MPHVPSMYRRKSDGRYAVNLSVAGRKRTVYLGRNRESAEELYRRTIAEWLVAPVTAGQHLSPQQDLSVAEVANAYLDFAEKKYRKPDGTQKTEVTHLKSALTILGRLYGTLPAREFDQRGLEAVRGEMSRKGGKRRRWNRKTVNDSIGRIKRMFRWAAARKLVPSTVPADLATLDGLRRGESEAPEGQGVGPVNFEDVHAIKAHVSPQIWAMIKVQLYTGARPGEVCSMRLRDLDMSGREWVHSPHQHKTAHRGHSRLVVIGPRAQRVLERFLGGDPERPIFSPKKAEEDRADKRHLNRQTPLSCGNRPGTNRVINPRRPPGDEYSVASYRRAIQRACDKAGVSRWKPHQLRHSAADRASEIDGPEGARCLLGHKTVSTTATYLSRDEERARRIVRKIG